MKKPAIPSVPLDAQSKNILAPLKESVEIITGQRGNPIKLLGQQASFSEITKKLNEIIRTLQNPAELEILVELPGAGEVVFDVNTYTYIQSFPASVWTIPHNLNAYPSVSVVDNSNNVLVCNVNYIDENIVQVTHGYPLIGRAYLNLLRTVPAPTVPSTVTYTQSVAATTWNAVHNLNAYPSVTVVDNSNNVLICDVNYIDENTVQIIHGTSLTGKVYFN